MNKILRIATLVLTITCFIGLVILSVNALRGHAVLAADPDTASEDYLGYGVLYASGFLLTSVFGLIVSFLSKKYSENKVTDIISMCIFGVCCVGVLVAAFFWFKFGYI